MFGVLLVGGPLRISSGGTSSTKVKLVSINVNIFPSQCRTVFSFHSKTFLPERTQTYSLFWWNLFDHQLIWALFVLGCTMFYLLLHDYVTMCHRKIYPTTREYHEIYFTCILYIHELAQRTWIWGHWPVAKVLDVQSLYSSECSPGLWDIFSKDVSFICF